MTKDTKPTGDVERAMENCMKLNRTCDSQGLIAQVIGTLESLSLENTRLREENKMLQLSLDFCSEEMNIAHAKLQEPSND